MNTRSTVISTLRSYAGADDRKSAGVFVFSLVAFVVLLSGSIYSYTIHPWLPVIFWIPIAMILSRFLVFEHDCGHNSLFNKRSHNLLVGKICGFLVMIPSSLWNLMHNTHHGLVGNLSKRSANPELWTS